MFNKQELTEEELKERVRKEEELIREEEELRRRIEQLENSPNDRIGLMADAGVAVLGAGGAGAAAVVLGETIASIPIITALTGFGMVVAAPVALVAGAAVVGGAAVYGVSRVIKDGGSQEGKRDQLLNELKEELRRVQAKRRQSNSNEHDKTRLNLLLKEALTKNLISPDDAHQLTQFVENGSISLSEACERVEQILSDSLITEPIKVVIGCPNCSQKLRAPSNLGQLTLTCPKCKHSWSCVPK